MNGDFIRQRFHEAHVEGLNVVFAALAEILQRMDAVERQHFLTDFREILAERLQSDSEIHPTLSNFLG